MRFLYPEYGWWLLGAFAVIAVLKWRVRWRFAAFTALLPRKHFPYRASIFRRLPFAVLAIGAAFASLAIMQPVIPYSQADLQSKGLDIVLLLDLSSSMQEEMGSGQNRTTTSVSTGRTRLDAVKDAVKTFIRTRRDDRIGLVVFSDNPYVISPLTFDHEYLLHYIDFVDDKILQGEGQTAIGDGLALADYVLSRQATKDSRGHQVIVLFTDGENNRGREPVEDFETVMRELESFSPELAAKPMLVVASKMDAAQDAARVESLRRLAADKGLEFFEISSATGQGLDALRFSMAHRVLARTE